MQKTSNTTENYPTYADRPHVLLVDDDRRIRDLLCRYLGEQGFVVMSAADAAEAESILQGYEFDVLVVDVMMPGRSGLEFTQDLRARINTPVLMLTALGETDDRISGLEAGADDYLAKPFEPRELLLRLNAIIKRTAKKAGKARTFKVGPWLFDPEVEELRQGDVRQKLTSAEVTLIKALASSEGDVLSRDELAQRCGIDAGERTIDVQVTRLRRKIEEDSKNPRYLLTLRGKGYLLRTEDV